MTTLTPAQAAGYAKGAGFTGDALVKAVAIAMAESGLRTDARGDVALQDRTWGPSLGLWQVRSVKAETGRGTPRDANRLTDPGFNAAAAWTISNHGKSFTPWSTYTSGAYLAHMSTASKAAGAPAKGGAHWWNDPNSPWQLPGQQDPSVPIIPDPLSGLGGIGLGAAGGALSGIDAIGGFFGNLGQRGTWVRVLQVTGGAGLIIGGAAIVGHGLIGDVATSVIPAGRAVKAVAAAAS